MGKNLKYGEFTFSAPKERPTTKGYARGGETKGQAKVSKVMGEFKSGKLHSGSSKGPIVKNPKQAIAIALSEKRDAGYKKGGEAKTRVKSEKLVGMKMEPEAIVKKEVALLKKSGAPAKLIKHEEREGALTALKKGGKACYAGGGTVTEQEMARENARKKSLAAPKKGAGAMSAREKQMMQEARDQDMDRAQEKGYREHYEREEAENRADRKAMEDTLMYIPRKIGEGARSVYDAVMGKKKGGEVHSDVAMDKKVISKAVHKHEAAMHPGKPLTKLKNGGKVKGYAMGGVPAVGRPNPNPGKPGGPPNVGMTKPMSGAPVKDVGTGSPTPVGDRSGMGRGMPTRPMSPTMMKKGGAAKKGVPVHSRTPKY